MKNLLILIGLFISFSVNSQDTANVRIFGGPYDDYGNDLIQTSDGGYAIIGTTGSYFQGNSMIYLIKLNAELEKEWTKVYGGNNIEWGKSILETDEGYFILGFTNSYGAGGYDAYLIKCDFEGEIISEHTYGGEDWDFASQIVAFGDNYMIVGETYSNTNGGSDAFVIQVDADGNELWSGNFGGNQNDYLNGAFVNNDVLIAVGTTESFSEKSKVFVLQVDENMVVSEQVLGNDDVWHEGANGILHSNGDMYLTGSVESGEFSNYLLMRLDQDFNVIPVSGNPLGGTLTENGYDIVETSNNQLVMVGRSDSFTGSTGAMVLRATETGSWQASPTFGGGAAEIGRSVILNSANEIVFVGETDSYGAGNFDVYLVKFPNDLIVQNYSLDLEECFDVLLTDVTEEVGNAFSETIIYPNPASSFVNIKSKHNNNEVVIYNLSGKVIASAAYQQNEFNLSLNNFTSGLYIVQLTSDKETEYLRLTIE